MKVNWALFYSSFVVWVVAGVVIFDAIVPMVVFILCGGVCGSLVLATEKKI